MVCPLTETIKLTRVIAQPARVIASHRGDGIRNGLIKLTNIPPRQPKINTFCCFVNVNFPSAHFSGVYLPGLIFACIIMPAR